MRHTGVTLMLEAGVNPRAIQTLAVWTTLRMLERYGHARDAEMRRGVAGERGLPATGGHKNGHSRPRGGCGFPRAARRQGHSI
jgi:hypothetical protein